MLIGGGGADVLDGGPGNNILIQGASVGPLVNGSLAPDANGAALSQSDGSHVTSVALLGQYMASSFVVGSDGHSGTLITDPPLNQQPLLTHPHA